MTVFVTLSNSFWGIKIAENVNYCFIGKTNLIMNIFTFKGFMPVTVLILSPLAFW